MKSAVGIKDYWPKIITARKRSLGQGYIFTGVCHSVNREGSSRETPLPGRPSCQGDTPHPPGRPPLRRPPCQGETPHQGDPPVKETPPLPGRTPLQGDPPPGPPPRGKLRGIRSRPTPKGEVEGIRSRPTPKGEIEGYQLQAHTQGGNSGGSGPDIPPPPRRLLLRAVRILLECILVFTTLLTWQR